MARGTRLLLAASLASLTCAKDATGPVLADRLVMSGPDAVYLGETAQFRATPVNVSGTPLPPRPITWSSSDTAVATVNQSGLVTTRALGAVTIQAAADGKSSGRALSVLLIPIQRIVVTPNLDSVFVGDSIQLTASVKDINGGQLFDRPVVWLSSDTMKATVTAGFVRTRAPGSFTITARSDTVTGGVFLNAQLRVAALLMPDSLTIGLHHSVRLVPDLRSGSGTHLSGRATVWSSLTPAVLDVTQSGVLQPHDTGSSLVVVRSGSFYDSSHVTVVPESVVSIGLSFISQGPFVDTTVEALEATPYDTFNLPTPAPMTWSSSDTTVLNIAPSPTNPRRALITGRHPGRVRVSATSGAASSSVAYTLDYPIVRFIANPDSVAVGVGEVWPIAGYGLDRFGTRPPILSTQEVIVADTTIAVGFDWVYVRGVRPGRTTALVRYENATPDTVPIVVLPVNIPRLTWRTGAIQADAYSNARSAVIDLLDSAGVPLAQPRDIRITSSDTSVAIPTPALITGAVAAESITVAIRKRGLAILTAGTDSQFTQLRVGVGDYPPIRLELAGMPASLQEGASFQLQATVRGFDGVPRPYPVTWTSSNVSRATVSDSGFVQAVSAGVVSIIASSDQASDTATLMIKSLNGPTVTTVTPGVLVPGAAVIIRGSGFDPDPRSNSVLVDGVTANISAASDTELALVLPAAYAWPCVFDHDARLVITSGGRVGLDSAPLHVATSRAPLAVGDTIGLDGDEARCNELAPVGTYTSYVVLAENTDPGIPLTLGFQGIAASVQSTSAPRESKSAPPGAATLQFSMDSLRNSARFHRRLLEQSQALSRRAGPPAPLLRTARQSQPLRSVTATINGVARVRIPKLEDPDFCASYRTIDARVVFTAPHIVILEDKAAPLAGTVDSSMPRWARNSREQCIPSS